MKKLVKMSVSIVSKRGYAQNKLKSYTSFIRSFGLVSIFVTITIGCFGQTNERLARTFENEIKEALAEEFIVIDTLEDSKETYRITIYTSLIDIGYTIYNKDGNQLVDVNMDGFRWGGGSVEIDSKYTLDSINNFSQHLDLSKVPRAKRAYVKRTPSQYDGIYEFVVGYK